MRIIPFVRGQYTFVAQVLGRDNRLRAGSVLSYFRIVYAEMPEIIWC